MRTLQERLDGIREGFAQKAPPAALEIMHRSTEELRASGVMERIPQVGDSLPAFELPDHEGRTIRSAELLAKGPLVISFYRGLW